MLDRLFGKCSSPLHFAQVIASLDNFTNSLKTSFNGPLEQDVINMITSLFGSLAAQPISTLPASNPPPNTQA